MGARELVLNCCSEFIHLVSSESNDICNNQQKKTISAEHVLLALEKLGYGEFRKDAEEVLSECKETAAKRRRQSTKLENLGIPEEELLRQQQSYSPRQEKLQLCRKCSRIIVVLLVMSMLVLMVADMPRTVLVRKSRNIECL